MSIKSTLISVSKKYSLNLRNLVEGAILAGITAVSSQVWDVFYAWYKTDSIGGLDWHSLLISLKRAGIVAGLYLVRQFFAGRKIVIANPSPAAIDAVKAGAQIQAKVSEDHAVPIAASIVTQPPSSIN